MKKYNTAHTSLAAIIVTLFALAPLAHAAVISGGATAVVGNGGGTVESQIKVTSSASATPVAGTHLKMEDGTIEAKTGMEVNGSDTKVHGIENAEIHANANAEAALEKAELHIDLDDEDMRDEGKGDINEAADVHSEIDFKHFVAHKAKADAHIKSVDVSKGEVEVEYEESGKWFGFLSGDINAHATADVKGNVEVKYPWYHIFMNGIHSSASLQSEIARAIAAEKKGEKEGISSTILRTDISAAFRVPNLFEIIANTLKKTSASATATTEVNTN